MADSFDALLISTASVLKKGEASSDGYGIGDTTFVTKDTNVPVRVCRLRSSREFRAGKKLAITARQVFMRPWVDPVSGEKLTHEHWLLIDGEYYDIQYVDDPSKMGHHLEVFCNIVEV